MTGSITGRMLIAATIAVMAALASGCASRPDPGTTAPPQGSEAGLLTTPAGATVLDDGQGARLCLGAVATSLPPQCGGPEVVGWDWAQWVGSYEEAAGVRWGSFTLVGAYDPDAFSFTPVEVRAGAGDPPSQGDEGSRFGTPCEAPPGGWRVVDATKTDERTLNAVFERAAALPGYAAAWVDLSRVPSAGPDATPEEQIAETAVQPALTLVNVMVVGDPAVAEAELRQVWGGMLCVTKAERTDAELQEIARELMPPVPDPGLLGVGADGMDGIVMLEVVHDDGTLQAELDRAYGPGVVRVVSALRSAG